MQMIYLSPHFDDVALSCGGLVWEQVQYGHSVAVWTLCAGIPPDDAPLSPLARELHERWQTGLQAVAVRRQEDHTACQRLGAPAVFFDWYDCIYRYHHGEPLIHTNPELFEAEPEEELVAAVMHTLIDTAPSGAQLVCPMALRGHVDHRLVRTAAERSGLPLLYYIDYPHILFLDEAQAEIERGAWQRLPGIISGEGLQAWQDAVAAYITQISTFWHGEDEMRLALRNYWAGGGGRLWRGTGA
jgi:LmbE family N-acetylglucosaminyl deacetylase